MNKYLILLILLIMPLNSLAQQQIANQLSNFVAPVTYFVDHVKQLALLTNNLIKYRQASIVGTSGMEKPNLLECIVMKIKITISLFGLLTVI
ncbi:MAG: hypothetical protein QMO91_06960 [Candidatus Tisiphia sp.]|nr:hypothetical protein [Candidatus Tisiphia sp.]